MAIARRRRPRTLKGPGRQLELDGKIRDARFAEVKELDDWKVAQEEKARQRWLQLLNARRSCQGRDRCTQTAVILCQSWRVPGAVNAIENASFCLKHWPDGEGRALQSPCGWLDDGRALADLGWRPDMQWAPAGEEGRSLHRVRGDLGSEPDASR